MNLCIVCSIVYSVSPVVFPDPSLTADNLSTVLDSMSDEQWEWFGRFANIPYSELERIRRQYSSERERKQAVIHSLTSTHPALSWTRVAHALYWTVLIGSNESCLRALDRLQQLFPIGTVHYVYVPIVLHVHVYTVWWEIFKSVNLNVKNSQKNLEAVHAHIIIYTHFPKCYFANTEYRTVHERNTKMSGVRYMYM